MPVVLLAATLALPPPSLPQLWVTPPDTEPDGLPLWTWPDRSTQLPSPTCTTSAVRLSPLPSPTSTTLLARLPQLPRSTSTTLPVRPLPLPSPTSTTPPVRSTPPPSPTSTSSPSQPQLPSLLPPQLLPTPLLQLLPTLDTLPWPPPWPLMAPLAPSATLVP